MPNWVIKIKKGPNGEVVFDPQEQVAMAKDIISWSNYDTQAHWPAPIKDGVINQTGFIPKAIEPGQSSIGYVVPSSTQDYCCAYHPEERGVIEVITTPPAL